jgi:valyl-tRNA synthetase
MTTALTGQVPFKNVFLHGIIRDANKQKMSKSKGNVIDPLEMTSKYGTDALRFALVFNTAPGTDMAMAEDKIKGMKHFGNKLWNIARYVLAVADKTDYKTENLTEADADIVTKLQNLKTSATSHLDNFRLHEAAQEIYQFVWHEFADVYIEASKEQLKDEKLAENTKKILIRVLINSTKLLHPFMPFITEELWSKFCEAGLIYEDPLIMVSKWPEVK